MSEVETPAPEKAKGKGKGKGKDGEKKGSPVKLIVLLVVGLVGGLMLSKMMGGGGAAAVAVKPKPVPGEVAAIEAININLEGGHFLRIAVGAQLVKTVIVKPEVWSKTEGAKVRDAMIEVYSGKKMEDLQKPDGRKELLKELEELAMERTALEGPDGKTTEQVIGIYLTEFVMQ